jgi:hypothetical protein
MDPPVIAALIAAVVSSIGAAVAYLSARWQLQGKLAEIEVKKQEVEKVGVKLQAEAEALRQSLMRDVLAKRMLAYAALWKLLMTYERNRLVEETPFDHEWAADYLAAINACNAEHGVFFSETVYKAFFEYRKRLAEILKSARGGHAVTPADVDRLVEISTTGVGPLRSLAGAMKDDLGSYTRVVIQAG